LRCDTTLGLDTSGPWIALALLRADTVLAQDHLDMDRGQAEALMPAIHALLARAGVTLGDLTRIGVGTGPGNFTGVRLSVALARGLSMSLGVPAIGVTRFQARAFGLPEPIAIVEDARHGAVYLQETGDEPRITDLDALALEIGGMPLAGNAARAASERTGGTVLPSPHALAVAIARIAATAPADSPRPAPLYLRPADAAPSTAPLPSILP
jgi:tRNA threonylcarbamoyladenosine biosynthesis protein TsaB